MKAPFTALAAVVLAVVLAVAALVDQAAIGFM